MRLNIFFTINVYKDKQILNLNININYNPFFSRVHIIPFSIPFGIDQLIKMGANFYENNTVKLETLIKFFVVVITDIKFYSFEKPKKLKF